MRILPVRTIVAAAAFLVIGNAGTQTAQAQATGWLSRAANAVRSQLDTSQPRVVRRSIELTDADIATLQSRLSWIGIELPLELQGDVTARLGIVIELSALRDAKSYQITGSLSSRQLIVEGLELQNLSASARYVDGRLTLEQLVVTVPDPRRGATAGRAVGEAALQLLPVGSLSATLQLDGLPMEPLNRRIEAAQALVGGRLAGRLNVEAPISNLRDVNAWRGTGSLTLTDLVAARRTVSQVVTRADLADSLLTVTDLDGTIAGERLTGSATLSLTAPFRYRVAATVPQGELTRMDALFATELPANWSGKYVLTASASGSLRPFQINASTSLTGDRWTVAGVPIESFQAEAATDGQTLSLSMLDARLRGGRVAGEGRLTLDDQRRFSFRLRPDNFDLAALEPAIDVAFSDGRSQRVTVGYRAAQTDAEDASENAVINQDLEQEVVPEDDPMIAGTADGDIDVSGQALPFRLDGLDGSLTIENLTIAGVSFDRAELVADTQNRTLVLSRLLLVKGEGRLSGEGRVDLDAPGAFSASLRPERFAIDAARPLFGERVSDVDLPAISGQLDGTLEASGQTQPFALETLSANVAGDDIRIGGLHVDRFEVAATTAEETIDVSNILVVVEDGRLTGNATLGLAGEQPFEATLRPQAFRIELLQPLFGDDGVIDAEFPPVSGRVTGEMTLRGRVKPTAVDGVSGRIDVRSPTVSGIRFERAGFAVTTTDGIARIHELAAVSDFGTLRGTGTVRLETPHDVMAELAFDEFDLSALGRLTASLTAEQRPDLESPAEVTPGPGVLPIDLEGRADVTGNIRGTLSPLVLTAEGTTAAETLGLDARELSNLFRPTTLTSPRFNWRYSERRLTLEDISAEVGTGTLAGTAAVPLGEATTGMLELSMEAVELADVLDLPANAGGTASAEIVAELGVADESGTRPLTGQATLSMPAVRAGRITAGDFSANVSLLQNVIEYDATGTLFAGTLTASGTWPLDEERRDIAAGSLRWTGASLARVAAAFDQPGVLDGVLDVSGDYDLSQADAKGTGTVRLANVRSRDQLVTDRLQARVVWEDSTIRVENAGGGIAGGTVSFTVTLDALNPSRSRIEITLRRADAQRAVGWIPGLEPLEGTLNGQLRGNFGRLWHWEGEGEITRGRYGPLGFSSWRVPIDIDANPARGAMRIELRRTTIRAARGRASLNLTYLAGTSNRFTLDATFDRLEAGQLLGSRGTSGRLAGGRISGTAELSSRNLRSIADLEGAVVATFSGSQAQNLPVFGSVLDVAQLPTGGGGTIERGEVRATIRRGVVRFEEILLAGPSFRMFAEGTATLPTGRLALDVVADTSPARGDRILAGILLRQFFEYSTPIGWIARANRFIAERAIYLRVTGTYRRPVVRIRPVEQLGQEAVRFFLMELAGPVGGAAAVPGP